MEPTGYTYEAAVHCVSCTEIRFEHWNTSDNKDWLDKISHLIQDSEGNAPSPIFSITETEYVEYCDDCGEEIDTTVINKYVCLHCSDNVWPNSLYDINDDAWKYYSCCSFRCAMALEHSND